MSKSDQKKSLFDRIRIKVEKKIGKSTYGKVWTKDNQWYNEIHNANPLLHEDFVRYIKEKKDVKTVLEIGCGTGIYPIQMKEIFEGIQYAGIDISENAIEYCKKNSKFEFICGDFIKMDITKRYDLVYSHAVVDHVYDIDAFISKMVKISKKYTYINSYRGYFPEMKEHKMTWDGHDGCYFNDLSIQQTRENLLRNGLSEDEFVIRSQESGQQGKNVNLQTVIEIKKNQD
ncbi:MAG TPA: class I SAM-dependent methyltransferase [Nitrosopumilaceae archaeon]|nr:class I SAM-dependent methyltransferase [Nitrosopumilaceae archaeon]